jgi:hypothetical protein
MSGTFQSVRPAPRHDAILDGAVMKPESSPDRVPTGPGSCA